MHDKTNLLKSEVTTNRVGLIFLFVTVCSLGVALVTSGVIALMGSSEQRARAAAPVRVYKIEKVINVTSNEKANPGEIGIYLGDNIAGAVLENSVYSPVEKAPAPGMLGILFVNPSQTNALGPTTVQFPAQTLVITSERGKLTVCTPSIPGGTALWVSQNGNTYSDKRLSTLARAC